MSLVRAVEQGISALLTIWFIGLGMAIMLGIPGRYARRTQAWVLWPFALVLRTANRWLLAVLKALVRWVIHHTRHW